MALQKALTTSQGVELAEAYVRVLKMNGDKEQLEVHVGVYASAAARNARKQPVERRTYLEVPTPEDGPVLQKIYDWLKANEPLFDGAIDV